LKKDMGGTEARKREARERGNRFGRGSGVQGGDAQDRKGNFSFWVKQQGKEGIGAYQKRSPPRGGRDHQPGRKPLKKPTSGGQTLGRCGGKLNNGGDFILEAPRGRIRLVLEGGSGSGKVCWGADLFLRDHSWSMNI